LKTTVVGSSSPDEFVGEGVELLVFVDVGVLVGVLVKVPVRVGVRVCVAVAGPVAEGEGIVFLTPL